MNKIFTVSVLLALSGMYLQAQTMPKQNEFPSNGAVIIAPTPTSLFIPPTFQFNLGIFESDPLKVMGGVTSVTNDYQKALIMLTQPDPRGSIYQYLGIDTRKIASSSSFGISAVSSLYYTAYNHIFSTTGKTNTLVISNSGNVGIGTSSPAENLHVLGNGKFSGDMWVNNIHKVATLSQDQTFTGIQTFDSDAVFNGNKHFNTDGLKLFKIRNVSMNTFLEIGIAEDTYHYHFASKRGDIIIRRLGHEGLKRLIISTGSTPNSDSEQAVGILGADSFDANGIWTHNNQNVRIGAYSPTAPAHKLEVNGSVLFDGGLQIKGNGVFDGGLQAKGNGVFDAGLQVKGTIKTSEVIIEAKPADFVFEPDYGLRPLNEVETFIKENKHLPDVPSAAQMEKEGVGVAEMNKLLLQKIEELTLYVIELQKELQKLKATKSINQ